MTPYERTIYLARRDKFMSLPNEVCIKTSMEDVLESWFRIGGITRSSGGTTLESNSAMMSTNLATATELLELSDVYDSSAVMEDKSSQDMSLEVESSLSSESDGRGSAIWSPSSEYEESGKEERSSLKMYQKSVVRFSSPSDHVS